MRKNLLPSRVFETMKYVFGLWLKFPGNPDPARTGGLFGYMNREGKNFVAEIGLEPDEKRLKHTYLVVEKPARRRQNPGHISSYQSRNPEEGEYGLWGGDIEVNEGEDFTFTGCSSDQADEALVLMTAILEGVDVEVERIVEASNNTIFTDFREFVDVSL